MSGIQLDATSYHPSPPGINYMCIKGNQSAKCAQAIG